MKLQISSQKTSSSLQKGNKKTPIINYFIEVRTYKINAQKSIAFLFTNNEYAKTEIKNTIVFPITPKKILRYTPTKT